MDVLHEESWIGYYQQIIYPFAMVKRSFCFNFYTTHLEQSFPNPSVNNFLHFFWFVVTLKATNIDRFPI